MRSVTLSGIALCLLLIICSPTLGEDTNTSITLERGICFGTCPVYTLTIFGNGSIVYEGKEFVKELGIRNGSVNASIAEELFSLIDTSGFIDLADSYSAYDITDMPSATITLITNGKVKRVEHYHGDMTAPPILTDLENAIDQTADVTRWTEPWEPVSSELLE